jgi:serine/threonine protein phosphatase 1
VSQHFLAQTPGLAGADRTSTGGRLIYAVGDIHGRMDLLEPLLDQIRQDAFDAPRPTKPVLIFIGDYIDRGPSSRAVIERLIGLKRDAEFEVCALKGNHEAAVLGFLQNPASGPAWSEQGGAQTLASYGVTPPASATDAEAWSTVRDAFALALPLEHLNFLSELVLTAAHGDYVFVHAGLRPGLALEAQSEVDLLWIRDEFLNEPGPFENVVVHGHTPMEKPFMGEHRINTDTGAYATGTLTAVRLADGERRFIQSGAPSALSSDRPVDEKTRLALPALRASGLSITTLVLSVVLLAVVVLLIRGPS